MSRCNHPKRNTGGCALNDTMEPQRLEHLQEKPNTGWVHPRAKPLIVVLLIVIIIFAAAAANRSPTAAPSMSPPPTPLLLLPPLPQKRLDRIRQNRLLQAPHKNDLLIQVRIVLIRAILEAAHGPEPIAPLALQAATPSTEEVVAC